MRQLAIILSLLACLASNSQAALTLTYITSLSSATDASTYNFGNVTAGSDGLLVCVVVSRSASNASVTSVSIGGTNGAIPVGTPAATATNTAAIATREVTAGAHNVTVNFDQTMVRCGVGVYLLTGYASTTPVDTDLSQSTSSTGPTLTMDFPTSGKAVYGMFRGVDNNTTWTTATEDYDASPEASARFSFANKTDSGAGVVVTATGITNVNNVGVSAVWEAASLPVITTSGTQTLQESTRLVCQLEATGDEPFTWTIPGGADAAKFSIVDVGGDDWLQLDGSADFENPEDADTNGVYLVELNCENSSGDDDLSMSVTITDEGGGGFAPDPLGGGIPIP